mmetsp:Transcript_33296/g.81819  ORF Transcript_33296/g.81819 Transcript_33296/m.81819 type:complete len:215 (+) Transcript_33296:2078-2722(+)
MASTRRSCWTSTMPLAALMLHIAPVTWSCIISRCQTAVTPIADSRFPFAPIFERICMTHIYLNVGNETLKMRMPINDVTVETITDTIYRKLFEGEGIKTPGRKKLQLTFSLTELKTANITKLHRKTPGDLKTIAETVALHFQTKVNTMFKNRLNKSTLKKARNWFQVAHSRVAVVEPPICNPNDSCPLASLNPKFAHAPISWCSLTDNEPRVYV